MQKTAKSAGSMEQLVKKCYYAIFEGEIYEELPPIVTVGGVKAIIISDSELCIEQNSSKQSKTGERARQGEKILWYIDNKVCQPGESRYRAVIVDREFRWL